MLPEDEKSKTSESAELLAWFKVAFRPQVRAALEEALPDSASRRVYKLTNGANSTRDIAKESGRSPGYVSTLWQEWQARGLVSDEGGGRRRAVFDLSELGLSPVAEMEKGK